MILVLTSARDDHADRVVDLLRTGRVPHVRFDPAGFPARASLSVELTTAGAVRRSLKVDGAVVDLDDVRAVWYRRPGLPSAAPSVVDLGLGPAVADEAAALASDVSELLDAVAVPGPRPRVRWAQQRLPQLRLAASL